MVTLGIDIGGSGIKANLIDTSTGKAVAERHKIPTPRPSTPERVARVITEMVDHFSYQGPAGCTFPGIVRHGVVRSAANMDASWVGVDADELFKGFAGSSFTVLNDADAAAIGEARFGAARNRSGVVLVLTFGTGIGSGLVVDGNLVPNTELGHLHLNGHAPVERWCSARARDDEGLSWKEWANRVGVLLRHLDRLFSPDLFVIGGGVSRKFDKYAKYLQTNVETVPARLENEAGIVGAALMAG